MSWRRLGACKFCDAEGPCYTGCECAKCVDPVGYETWKVENPDEYEEWLSENEE